MCRARQAPPAVSLTLCRRASVVSDNSVCRPSRIRVAYFACVLLDRFAPSCANTLAPRVSWHRSRPARHVQLGLFIAGDAAIRCSGGGRMREGQHPRRGRRTALDTGGAESASCGGRNADQSHLHSCAQPRLSREFLCKGLKPRCPQQGLDLWRREVAPEISRLGQSRPPAHAQISGPVTPEDHFRTTRW